MTIEHATMRAVEKPWGRSDLQPWTEIGRSARQDRRNLVRARRCRGPEPALLLKLLFTDQPLSIQVHPGDPTPN